MLKIIILSSLLFFSLLCGAEVSAANNSNRYYDMVFLGEKDFQTYSGPLDPTEVYEKNYAEKKFLDQVYYETFFHHQFEKNIFEWEKLWFKDLPKMSYCPNFYLNENIDYIRYLYRLITISYLFESMKEHAKLSYQLGFKDNICDLNWKDVFGKCNPHGEDMTVFTRRTKYRYLLNYDLSAEKQMNRSEAKVWTRDFREKLASPAESIVEYRVKDWCHKSENCRDFSLDELKEGLKQVCKKDRELIHKTCSEEDSFYGLSHAEGVRELILQSNVTRVINDGGFAEACLKRFSELFESKERR